jgi:hypothetical protein
MAALPLGSPGSSLASGKRVNLLRPWFFLTPPVPGLHPPDKPGAFLFQDFVRLNQPQRPLFEIPIDPELASARGSSVAPGFNRNRMIFD